MMANPEHLQTMTPMVPLTHSPPMHGMAMAYGTPPPTVFQAPPGAVFHPGMQSPIMAGGIPTVPGGCDGSPGGFMAMPPPPPQQAMFQFEQMSNPVAAAIAACPPLTTVTVGIPDNMIGAILGPGGATISELQSTTGARIIVSQRDEFLPGTENRILTISGAPMATQVNNVGRVVLV